MIDGPSETPASRTDRAKQALQLGPQRLELVTFEDFDSVREQWLAFERSHGFGPFQSYDWFHAFWQSGSAGAGTVLRIIAGYDASGLVLLAPLAVTARRLGVTARVLGDSNASQRSPVMAESLLRTLDPAEARTLAEAIGRLAGCDALLLDMQPQRIMGLTNPWYDLGAIEYPDQIADALLDRPWPEFDASHRSASTRSKERNREKALNRLGSVEFVVPTEPGERLALFEHLLAQKRAWLREQNGSMALEKQTTQDFLRSLVLIERPDGPFAHLCALKVGGELASASLGVVSARTFCGLVLSVDPGKFSRQSPGQLLLSKLLQHCSETGVERFSFGLGVNDLKERWTDEKTPVFSTAFVITYKGAAAVAVARALWWAKAALKRNRRIYEFLLNLRALMARMRLR